MITLYTKPACPYCVSAKTWLTNNGFAFKEVDITADAAAYTLMKANGHRTVPQIYFNGELLVNGGFDGLKSHTPEQVQALVDARS